MKSKIYLLLFIFCVVLAHNGISQNILKEDFENTSLYEYAYAIPTNWVDVITWDPGIDQVNWTAVKTTSGVAPESGSYMEVFGTISLPITPGGYGRGYLETYPIDFTKDTVGQIIVTCWMYRDTVSVPVLTRGKVDVYVSNNEFPWDGSSALLGTIYVADSPFVTKNGWYEYRFYVPDSFKKFTSNYILWWGLTDSSHNQYLDNISIDQFGADTLSILHPEEDTLVCMGAPLNVTYGANHPFNTDNVFKVELSDSSGSFSSPTVIGKDSTDVLATIPCTLPSVMSTTKGYRIRIVSTSPAETSPDNGYDIHAVAALSSFSASNNGPICYGDSLKLSASTTDAAVSYLWTAPYHFVSNNPDTTILYNHLGEIYFTITVSRNGCNSVSQSFLISTDSLHPRLTRDSSNSPLCPGSTLRLYSSSNVGGATFKWSGPDSFSSTTTNPTIANMSASDTGEYYLYAVFNGCVSPVDTIDIQMKPLPAIPSDSSNGPVCIGSPLKLYGNDTTAGVQYIWSGPGSFNDTEQNPVISSATTRDTGKFYVFATLNKCNSAKDSIKVIITHLPATPSDSSNSPVCAGSELKLFSKDDTSGVTYSWSGPDSFSSTTQDPTIATTTLTSSGFYYVTVEKNGCLSHLDSINIKISPLPIAPSDSSNSPVCLGSKLELFSKDDTSGVTYSWTGPDGFTALVQNPTISATIAKDSGFYFVVAKKNGCLSSEDSIRVTIDSVIIPTVKISVSPDTLVSAGATVTFTAAVTGGGTSPIYKWLKNNVVIPGATTNTYVTNKLADKDVITAVVQSDAMCAMPDTAISNAVRIGIIPTDVPSVNNGSDIVLYPNPNNGSFIIKGSIGTVSDKVSVEILNMVGQVVYSNIIPLQNGTLNSSINLNSNIANGVYLLRLKADQQQDIMRFTLQR